MGAAQAILGQSGITLLGDLIRGFLGWQAVQQGREDSRSALNIIRQNRDMLEDYIVGQTGGLFGEIPLFYGDVPLNPAATALGPSPFVEPDLTPGERLNLAPGQQGQQFDPSTPTLLTRDGEPLPSRDDILDLSKIFNVEDMLTPGEAFSDFVPGPFELPDLNPYLGGNQGARLGISPTAGNVPGVVNVDAEGNPIDTSKPIDLNQFTYDPSDLEEIAGNVGAAFEGIAGGLQGRRLAPGTLFGQVDFPEYEGEAELAKLRGDIAVGNREATELARQQVAARALGAGQPLLAAQSSQDLALRDIQDTGRTLARNAAADVEQKVLENERARASMQFAGAATEADINRALDLAASNLRGTGASTAAHLLSSGESLEAANLGLLSGLEQFNLQYPMALQGLLDDRELQQFLANLSAGQASAGTAAQDIGIQQGSAANTLAALGNFMLQPNLSLLQGIAGLGTTAAGIQQNFPVFMPTTNFDSTAIDAWNAARLANAGQPKDSFGVSVLGTGFNTGCIDGMGWVQLAGGKIVMLMNVEVGDEVVTPSGETRKVLYKDYGTSPIRDQHVQIITNLGPIVCTRDHRIGGFLADEWLPGEKIEMAGGIRAVVLLLREHPYVVSGDLYVEGNADYIVNGFVVASNIGRNIESVGGLSRYLELKAAHEARIPED